MKIEKQVTIDTKTVGIHFATCGIVREVGSKAILHYCLPDRPYGFHVQALLDARTWAIKNGYIIVEGE